MALQEKCFTYQNIKYDFKINNKKRLVAYQINWGTYNELPPKTEAYHDWSDSNITQA
jgi:hypothetical protein